MSTNLLDTLGAGESFFRLSKSFLSRCEYLGLSSIDGLVAMFLLDLLEDPETPGSVYASSDYIHDRLGVPASTARDSLRRMEKLGLLKVTKREGFNRSKRYDRSNLVAKLANITDAQLEERGHTVYRLKAKDGEVALVKSPAPAPAPVVPPPTSAPVLSELNAGDIDVVECLAAIEAKPVTSRAEDPKADRARERERLKALGAPAIMWKVAS